MPLAPPPRAQFYRRLAETVQRDGACALVSVVETKGSAPREAGAMMGVTQDGAIFGTIGGGALEWEALVLARQLANAGEPVARRIDRALGPDLGQCCGGRVLFDVRVFVRADMPDLAVLMRDAADSDPRQPLAMFGAGHVGRALALSLAPLPFRVTWIDGRHEAFPSHIPANVEARASADPPAEIAAVPPGGFVLVLTHDHALDLAITAAALARPDLPYVGLIGSATKRARFEKRLRELGLPGPRIANLVCPIGLPAIAGKEPAVIAASVAAQLLACAERPPETA